MESNTFKSVAFGGFDKQDVISYIERISREAVETQEQLQKECEGLRQELQILRDQSGELQSRLEEAEGECTHLRQELDQETARRQALEAQCQELESLRPEAERLGAQVESMRDDAAAYARFRGQIGAIECEARQRAAGLEDETAARLRQVAERFGEQYRVLMSTFESAAAHVNSELRKIEVNLTQLPRTMDQSGTELKALEALLARREETED